jgi:hypothetical protein
MVYIAAYNCSNCITTYITEFALCLLPFPLIPFSSRSMSLIFRFINTLCSGLNLLKNHSINYPILSLNGLTHHKLWQICFMAQLSQGSGIYLCKRLPSFDCFHAHWRRLVLSGGPYRVCTQSQKLKLSHYTPRRRLGWGGGGGIAPTHSQPWH